MNKDITTIANVASAVTMLTAAISWLVFGGQAAGLALCVGSVVGVTVFSLLAWQSFRHHSHNQPRDVSGRFVPVRERGKIVQWVLVEDESPKNGGETGG